MEVLDMLPRRRRRAGPGVLRRAPKVAAAEEGGRTVLLDVKRGRYYGLDPVAGRIWELLGEALTLEAIVDRLEEEYAAPRERLEADARAFVEVLRARKLIVEG
jgi:hypothetical protein